jgi:hypothetical protein
VAGEKRGRREEGSERRGVGEKRGRREKGSEEGKGGVSRMVRVVVVVVVVFGVA